MIQILCQGGCAPEPPVFFIILNRISILLILIASPVLLIVSLIFFVKWLITKKTNKEKKNKMLKRSKNFLISSLVTFWIPNMINIFAVSQKTVGHAISATGKILGVFFIIVASYNFIKWLLELTFKKSKNSTLLKKTLKFLVICLLSVILCHLLGNTVDAIFPNELIRKDETWVTCWCA